MNLQSPFRILRPYLYWAYRRLWPTSIDHLPRYVAGGLKLGRDVQIQPGVKIDSGHYWHISIGDEVTIAPEVQIIAHDASTKRHLGYTRIGKIDIGDRAFIGAGSILLPGVSIGENSIIGAGSVVVCSIPANVVAAGNPAKVICSLASFLERRRREIAASPCFEEDYTLRHDLPLPKRVEMNGRMENRIGYVR